MASSFCCLDVLAGTLHEQLSARFPGAVSLNSLREMIARTMGSSGEGSNDPLMQDSKPLSSGADGKAAGNGSSMPEAASPKSVASPKRSERADSLTITVDASITCPICLDIVRKPVIIETGACLAASTCCAHCGGAVHR